MGSYSMYKISDMHDPEEDGDEEDPKELGLTVTLNAAASATVTPEIDIGLFADAGVAEGHAAVTLSVDLKGGTEAQVKYGAGSKEDYSIDALDVSDTCKAMDFDDDDKDTWGVSCCSTSGLPYCFNKDICGEKHHTQIDLYFEVEAKADMELHAAYSWGEWEDEFTSTRYVTQDGLQEDEDNFFHMYLHATSACFGELDDDDSTTAQSVARPAHKKK